MGNIKILNSHIIQIFTLAFLIVILYIQVTVQYFNPALKINWTDRENEFALFSLPSEFIQNSLYKNCFFYKSNHQEFWFSFDKAYIGFGSNNIEKSTIFIQNHKFNKTTAFYNSGRVAFIGIQKIEQNLPFDHIEAVFPDNDQNSGFVSIFNQFIDTIKLKL